MFWAEKPDAQARHALNEALRRLRAALGAGRLVSVADAVAIAEADLWVDALQFMTVQSQDADAALGLLRGDLLEGFVLSDAGTFDEWALGERQRHRARAVAMLVAVGEGRLAACHFAQAIDLAQRALSLEPYSEPGARLAMRAAALNGDPSSGLATYHRFAERLKAELGEAPSGGLKALADQLRRRPQRAPGAPDQQPPPLTGRSEVHGAVFELLEHAAPNGATALIITGSPGMGRTRLLEECLQRLVLEGTLIARAKPLHSDHDAAWSALRALVRMGLRDAPGLVAASPDALGVLGSLVPELAGRGTAREPRDAGDASHAVASILGAIAEEVPVVVAIDDAHLADGATIGALDIALQQLRAAPLLVALTVVEGEPATPELTRLRGQVGRSLRGLSVRLDPLTPANVHEMVGAMAPWCRNADDRDRLARRLMFESSGNPFFVVTLLHRLEYAASLRQDLISWPRAQDTLHQSLPFSIPNLLNLSVAGRVADLSGTHRRILCAASVAGQALDMDLLAELVEMPRPALEAELPELERRHFLSYDGERYAFVAPLLADIVSHEYLTRGERTALRRRAAAALASRQDLEGRVLRVELRSRADPGEPVAQEALVVAADALDAGSTRSARRALAAAERSVLTGAVPARLQELRDRLRQALVG